MHLQEQGVIPPGGALRALFTLPIRAFRPAILARYDHFLGILKMLVRQRIVFFALSFFALALLSGVILPLSTIEWKALWIGLCFFGLFAAHRMGPMQSLDELGLCDCVQAVHPHLTARRSSVGTLRAVCRRSPLPGVPFSAALSACPVVVALGRHDDRFGVRPGPLEEYAC